jgi:predicted DNA-binding ribbon-helix-helix protein
MHNARVRAGSYKWKLAQPLLRRDVIKIDIRLKRSTYNWLKAHAENRGLSMGMDIAYLLDAIVADSGRKNRE